MTRTRQDEVRAQALAWLIMLVKFLGGWQLYSLTVAALMGTSLTGAFVGGLFVPIFALCSASLGKMLWEDSKEPWTDAGFLVFAWVATAVMGFLAFAAFAFALVAPWLE